MHRAVAAFLRQLAEDQRMQDACGQGLARTFVILDQSAPEIHSLVGRFNPQHIAPALEAKARVVYQQLAGFCELDSEPLHPYQYDYIVLAEIIEGAVNKGPKPQKFIHTRSRMKVLGNPEPETIQVSEEELLFALAAYADGWGSRMWVMGEGETPKPNEEWMDNEYAYLEGEFDKWPGATLARFDQLVYAGYLDHTLVLET